MYEKKLAKIFLKWMGNGGSDHTTNVDEPSNLAQQTATIELKTATATVLH